LREKSFFPLTAGVPGVETLDIQEKVLYNEQRTTAGPMCDTAKVIFSTRAGRGKEA